jgi:hypothetical protein
MAVPIVSMSPDRSPRPLLALRPARQPTLLPQIGVVIARFLQWALTYIEHGRLL